MRVVGKGLLLRAAPALDADRLAMLPFEAVVMVHEEVTLEDGTVRVRCGADVSLPETAEEIQALGPGWPCDGWGSRKVLAELVHPPKPGDRSLPAWATLREDGCFET